MEKNWIVVKFLENNSVEAVPTNWILGNKCYWPPYADNKVTIDAIKKRENPDVNTWQLFDVTFFRNNVFSAYIIISYLIFCCFIKRGIVELYFNCSDI